MNIEITVRHFAASNNVREHAIKKVQKINRFFDRPIGCHVILTHENGEHSTEINLSVSGKQIFVKDTSDDVLKSIDGAVDKLVARVKKFKDTRYSHN